jgi:hypothetical protein
MFECFGSALMVDSRRARKFLSLARDWGDNFFEVVPAGVDSNRGRLWESISPYHQPQLDGQFIEACECVEGLAGLGE